MKKKGFTLIELLAVIVILAVLALILTPMIQNLIINAREAAFKQTINGIMDAAENYVTEYTLNHNGNGIPEEVVFTCDGTDCKTSEGDKLLFSGKTPISGTITINEEGIVADNLCNESLCGSGKKDGILISGSKESIPACEYPVGTEWTFDYLDETNENRIHSMNIPCKGYYKLEVWGAQGGSYNATYHGGYGGYAIGNILLEETDTLYIAVGGAGRHVGSNSTAVGGFNGGGSLLSSWSDGNERRATGGGATHIALNNNLGELKNYVDNKDDILIVAGGGGGGQANAVMLSWGNFASNGGAGYGGSGGGTTGGKSHGQQYRDVYEISGGGQDTPVYGAGFGYGGSTISGDGNSTGAGGGWYGGQGFYRGAGGGSGHLSDKIINGEMYCYHCMDEEDDITSNVAEISEEAIEKTAKKNNGYAKVTYVGTNLQKPTQTVWRYRYTGSVQEFTAPETGTYKLEVWGAQGGSSKIQNGTIYNGGSGGYSTGEIILTKNDKLYIVVGGKGEDSFTIGQTLHTGGYNGGGTSDMYEDNSAGGGATHIATSTGELKDLSDNRSSILIVAGGGGGSSGDLTGGGYCIGGAGGGLNGIQGTAGLSDFGYGGQGGTQTSGFGFGIGTNGNAGTYGNETEDNGAGGGGGYYGGLVGHSTHPQYPQNTTYTGCSGGGSGYTGTLENAATIAGNQEMPSHDGLSTMIGNVGNGYAKITYIR